MLDVAVYSTLFFTGLAVGLTSGVLVMAGLRLGAKLDREEENMLDDAGYPIRFSHYHPTTRTYEATR